MKIGVNLAETARRLGVSASAVSKIFNPAAEGIPPLGADGTAGRRGTGTAVDWLGAGTSRNFTNRQNRGLGVQLDFSYRGLAVFLSLVFCHHRILIRFSGIGRNNGIDFF